MLNRNRSVVTGLAGLAAVLVVASSGAVAQQGRPNIDNIVRQFHVNYSNNQVEKNGDLVADDIVVELNGGASSKPNGATFRGREQFVNWLKQDKVVFPDGKITDHEVVVSGNKAAIRFTLNATHGGPLPTPNGPLPATGRKVVIQATEFFTFNDAGKLVHLETLTNDLGAFTQLTAK
jgi:ketosteroid isomerase-like protein